MGFAGVYRAVYAYSATNEQELSISEGDIVYLLETADDGWWSVKKRVVGAASEEPEGIVPHNYIEPAPREGVAHALYSYDSQNDEELSFAEGQQFDVYATEGDWVLVGSSNNQFGFVPANYISFAPAAQQQQPVTATQPAVQQQQQQQQQPAAYQPAAAAQPTIQQPIQQQREPQPVPQPAPQPAYDDEPAPPRPARPGRESSVRQRELPDEPPRERRNSERRESDSGRPTSLKGEMTWPVMDVLGRRKVPKTLVVAQQHVTLINDDGGGRTQRWEVPDIVRYSSEKKYVFLDLVHPPASLQLRVSSSSEANQIVVSLGQIVGAGRAGGGLQEVINAADSAAHKPGRILLDFKAANSKELSVQEGDDVVILNSQSKEWWLVRTVQGREGLVPRKFVHLEREENKLTGLFRGKKQREKQFERDQSDAREAARSLERTRSTRHGSSSGRRSFSSGGRSPSPEAQSGGGGSSSRDLNRSASRRSQASAGVSRSNSKSHGDKSLPDSRKMRLWVDRTGTFKVDAQLLGCSDGKVHLHKANGVKIAVPAAKLSLTDVEYVESVTGVNLGEDKPLQQRNTGGERSRSHSHSSRSGSQGRHPAASASNASNSAAAASGLNSATNNDTHDFWLSFFLDCGVDPQNANRYAKNFSRDNMDESNLADTNTSVLRTLGLREGDILRVTKRINERLGRVQKPEGGLYSTEGVLQNNSGTTPKSVENEVWSPAAQQSPIQPQLTQPQLQPQPTTQLQPAQLQPQITQPALQPEIAKPAQLQQQPTLQQPLRQPPQQPLQQQTTLQQPQPTGALADLLGMTSISKPSPAEIELAAKQKQTQQQILQMQAQLQTEQIRLLKQQQDQLRKQQDELVQIQKTGSQLQALGPFATGNAQRSSFQAPPVATSVLAAPQPPQSRPFQPQQPQPQPQPMLGQPSGVLSKPGGAIGQFTGPMQQTTGTFSTAGNMPSQVTGPFQATGSLPSQATGPFQSAASLLPNQATGPFQSAAASLPSQVTGPFQSQPQASFQSSLPATTTGSLPPTSFQSQPASTFQPQTTGPFQSGLPSQATGPFGVASQATGPFQSVGQLPLGQTNGPFHTQGQASGPFQSFPATGFQQPQQQQQQQHITGPFQQPLQPTPVQSQMTFTQPQQQPQQQLTTGPFQQSNLQQHTTGPFQQPNLQQHITGPFQQPNLQQHITGPFQQPLQPAPAQSQMSFTQQQPQQPQQQPQPTFGQSSFGQSTFGQQPPQSSFNQSAPSASLFGNNAFSQPAPAGSASAFSAQPLQNQATGFGFGNQPSQPRANLNMASASNPFGL